TRPLLFGASVLSSSRAAGGGLSTPFTYVLHRFSVCTCWSTRGEGCGGRRAGLGVTGTSGVPSGHVRRGGDGLPALAWGSGSGRKKHGRDSRGSRSPGPEPPRGRGRSSVCHLRRC